MKIGISILLISLMTFAFSQSGMDYYSAGMNAYASGNYKEALEWFEKALEIDPTIEQTDPYLKFRMGICAFVIKDYQKAKTYLSLYRDNEVAQQILRVIEKGVPEEEWRKWIKIPQEAKETSQAARVVNEKKGNFKKALLSLGISIVVFVSLFLIELKIMKLKELAKATKEVRQVGTVPEEEREIVAAQKTSEKAIEVPFEEIMRKEIEAIEELVQPLETEGKKGRKRRSSY